MKRSSAWSLAAALVAACSSVSPAVKDEDAGAHGAADTPSVTPDAPGASASDADTQGGDTPGAGADGGGTEPPPCEAPGVTSPAWYHEAVGYEIFVRSFQDSDGDGIGDLAGLTSRLDYLNDGDPTTDTDLGVTLLWLMPINQSPSYHGYDVTDYRAIEEDYGSLEDLDALLAAAHQRGIRVIMDLVLNHSSSQHPWFKDAAAGPGAPLRDHYVWSEVFLDWDRPWGPGPTWVKAGASWYYALFWEGMPDLNFTSAAVRAEMTDVARFWLSRGVDGFRLDAARYLVETGPGPGQADTPETHAFWRDLRAMMDSEAPGSMTVGEVWEQTSVVVPYFGTAASPELHMLFDFDGASGALQAVSQGKETALRTRLCKRLREYPPDAAVGTFLTNHDQARVATELGDEASLRLAAALLLGLPGTPWLYYGEEIGMKSGPGGGDEPKRLPMQWGPGGFSTGTPWKAPASTEAAASVAGQTNDPGSLLSWYRRLIRERQALPALSRGATKHIGATGSVGAPLVVLRSHGDQAALLVYSFASVPQVITVAPPLPATTFTDRLTGATLSRVDASAPLEVSLPARGFALLVP